MWIRRKIDKDRVYVNDMRNMERINSRSISRGRKYKYECKWKKYAKKESTYKYE